MSIMLKLIVVFALWGSFPHKAFCQNEMETPLVYANFIDENLPSQIAKHSGDKHLIIVSMGGSVKQAIIAAEILRREDWKITVSGVCNSACAGIILLGSDNITVLDGTLIGFHGNSLLKNHLYKSASRNKESRCFLSLQDREDALLEQAGRKRDFWKEQFKRLRPYDVRIGRPSSLEGCNLLHYKLEIPYWYPDSHQLRTLFGLKIRGKVGSDDFEKYRHIFEIFWKSGDRILVGDQLVTIE